MILMRPLSHLLTRSHSNHLCAANHCRSLYPENIMFGRDDKLRIGNYTSLVDLKHDTPTERSNFLDYMAPEMLAMKVRGQYCTWQDLYCMRYIVYATDMLMGSVMSTVATGFCRPF